MEYEKILEKVQQIIRSNKEQHMKQGGQEEDFYAAYRIEEDGKGGFTYAVSLRDLKLYRQMSIEELEEVLESLWEELEDLTDEQEALEEDSALDEAEALQEEKEEVKLSIALAEQILDEKSR